MNKNYPLHCAQENIFYDNLKDIKSDKYNIGGYNVIEKAIEFEVFRKSWGLICEKLDSLKLSFSCDNNGKVTQFFDCVEKEMDFYDFSKESEPEKYAIEWMVKEFAIPIDINKGERYNICLIKIEDEKFFLFNKCHHLLNDGFGLIKSMEYLNRAYNDSIEGNDLSWIDKIPSYSSSILKSEDFLSSKQYVKARDYWCNMLKNIYPTYLDDNYSSKGSNVHTITLNEDITNKLRLFCSERNVSLLPIIISVFSLYYSKFTGNDNVVINTPVYGRVGRKQMQTVGCLSNKILVPLSVNKSDSFIDLFERCCKTLVSSMKYSRYPQSQLSRELNFIDGIQSDITLIYDKYDFYDEKTTSVHLAPNDMLEKLDIRVVDFVNSPNLILRAHYSLSCFNGSEIEEMLSSLISLFEQILDGDGLKKYNEYKIVSDLCKKTQLEQWVGEVNDGYLNGINTIHGRFEEQVKITPNNIAISFNGQHLTYNQLNEKSNCLAHKIRCLYIEKENREMPIGTMISLCLERSLEMIIGVLAILKSGGCYVPIEPTLPDERIKYLIRDSNSIFVLTQEKFCSYLDRITSKKILTINSGDLDSNNELFLNNPNIDIKGKDSAYTIYTSGTTGQPKGVTNTHSNLINRISWMNEKYPLNNDNIMQKTPFSFDVSVWEIIWANWFGSKISISAPDSHKEPSEIYSEILNNHVTILHFVPSMLHAFCQFLKINELNFPVSVKHVFSSGEALTGSTISLFKKVSNNTSLHNLYGPTEAAIDVSYYNDCQLLDSGVDAPIGRPISNTKLYILDSERNLLPIGAVGELYIGGAGVAKGYLNKPELTKERFIDNPFATDSDKERGYTRLYKTGDLARWLPDGNIEYLGRNDFQVKIRGHRIELGEIDNALSIIEGVEQAVVIDRKDDTGRKYLAAYCVCASDNMDEEDLRMQLASKVPEFMMPSTFTFLESLPLTTNGKLDRRALPEPDLIDLSAYVAPATELETRLCTVWQQVLNLPKVGVYDHFFRIGGDSILSIQLVNALRKEGEYLQVKDIFECPTVKQLSQRLQETSSKEISAEQGELKGTFGLLPIQRLFFDKQLPNPNHFNQAFTLTVPNDWEPEAIVTSLKSLSDQHDMLRTHFKVNDLGEYEQTYTSESTLIELSVVNDEGWGDEERGAYLTGLHESLDVESNQLWRVVYFQRPNKEIGELCFIFHHLLIDAVSWRVISDDMKLLFEGQPLENKSSSYRQWVETLDQYASKHDSQRAYWESVVAQMELGTYPQVATNASPTMHQLTFNKERTEQLLTVSPQGYHTEVNDLLLSGLGLALKQVFGCDNPGVTLEGHGREGIDETIDSARTVGWFTTIYPVILPLGASVSDTIIQVKEQLRAIPDKGIGFGALMPTESKLPTVCFNYLGQLNGVDASEELWSLRAEQTGMSVSSENHDDALLTLNGAVVDGQLGFTVLSSLQEEETQAFIKAFEESLYEVIEQSVLQAKLGGIKTASDYIASTLPMERLKKLQSYYDIEEIYPASGLQQGFIYHALKNGDDAYCVQLLLDYDFPLCIDTFIESWKLASLRFPALRMAFDWDGVPLQIITQGASLSEKAFTVVDLSSLGKVEQNREISCTQQQEREKNFDLSQPGLIRFNIFKLADDRFTVLKTEHHSISDGWSGPVLWDTVHSYYKQLISEESVTMIPDTAYGEAQKWRISQQNEASTYWQSKRQTWDQANDITMLMKSDVTTSALNDCDASQKRSLKIDNDLLEELKATCAKLGVTLNVALQFAWHKLLNVYTGDIQTIVGTTVSGRDMPVNDIENSVGLYINTLPLIVNWKAAATCAQILTDIQQSIKELNTYSSVNLFDLQSEGESLFNSLFVFENYPKVDAISDDIFINHTQEKTDYPVSLIINEESGMLLLNIQYDSSHFDVAQVDKLLIAIENTLKQLNEGLEKPHEEINIVCEEEHQLLVHDWNQTDLPYPEKETLVSLFEAQVAASPDSIALVCDGRNLTYRALDNKANQLAHYLRSKYQDLYNKELPKGSLIGVYQDRSFEMIISILGILKAGGAYVPISPSYPEERVHYMVEDTALQMIVTQSHYVSALLDMGLDTLALVSSDAPEVYENSVSTIGGYSTPGSLAYVIYTSGTTGKPKGVMITNKNVVSLVFSQINKFDLIDIEKSLLFADYVFDASVFEMFVSLHLGHTLYLTSNSQRENIHLLGDFIKNNKIELATLPPSILPTLDLDSLSSIKKLIVAGESPIKFFMDEFSKNRYLFNAYGPTEATVCSSAHTYTNNSLANNIGNNLGNTRLYILDSERNLLPIGAVGELYIGGAGVAKGYLNKPELTKERFIDNPFATDSDKERGYTRLYKTGDLARWLPDGNIEYLGRNDFQVKIRGHRIELGEIDNALSIIEGVEQAVVIDRKDDTGRKYLAAYCVCASDNMDEEDLRMQLASKVPEFMMPSTFTFLESLPLTINGKLDRRALPEPDLIDLSAYVAPATELETRLCTVWQQVLNLPKVGVYDHFFRIGGDSILSIQLVNALRKEGEYLQVKDIFECPTVKQLAQRLQETSSKEISAEQGELKGTFGLLPIQRLFFDKQLPNPNHFNQAFTLTVPNDWEPEAIITSLKSLSDQHDMLRTHFKVNDLGEYEQTYTSESTLIELSVVNDEGWGDEERGAYLTGLHESLDVESNQLWRVVYFQRPNKEIGELCFIFHHLLIDAVSWRVISDDMKLLFEGQPLENKSSSYRQWVETLDQYASKHDSQRAYWESVVAQMELGTYPQVATNASPTMHQLTFNKERTEQLLTVSPQGYHTEVNDLLLSGLGLALKQVFGCDNPGVTLEGHGREGIDETIDSARTVGWFTTIYPVILPLGASVSDTIIQVKEQLRAIPDKGIGFGALMPTESKLPTVCFNYLGQLNGVDASEELWSLRAEQTGMSVPSENHDDALLTLNGAVVDGQLGFTVLSSLQEEETQAFIKAFEESLYEVIEQSVLQAKLGGIKTASDYIASTLPMERLKKLQSYYDIEEIYPASGLQQGFIYHALKNGDDAYCVQLLLDYDFPLCIDTFIESWKLASLRFPALRMAFDWDGVPLQIITQGASLSEKAFTVVDLSSLGKVEQNREISCTQQQEREKNFDLSQPGLIRFNIFKLADDRFTVLKTEHHSISDGWSGPVLWDTVHSYYKQLISEESVTMIPDTAYGEAQKWRISQQNEASTYWQSKRQTWDQANDITMLMKSDVTTSALNDCDASQKRSLKIDNDLLEELKATCAKLGVTLNVALQFAWHKLLNVYTGDIQTIVGTTVSGRDMPVNDIENSVGLYINTLPLIVNWKAAATCAQILTDIQQSIKELNTYSSVNLFDLQSEGESLFNSLFVFENYPKVDAISDDIFINHTQEKTDYPVSLIINEESGMLLLNIQYDSSHFDVTQVDKLLIAIENTLKQLNEGLEKPHEEINIVCEEEHQLLVHDWNQTDLPYPEKETLVSLFEAQVAASPDSIALVCDGRNLTYRALDNKANQLAHYLRSKYQDLYNKELPKGSLIGVYQDRSFEMIISILGILKAGGAYVPISPSYPEERVHYMVEDTALQMIVTQSHYVSALLDMGLDTLALVSSDAPEVYENSVSTIGGYSTPESLAYVIYTSGTTGKPKGVMTPHRGVVSLVCDTDFIDITEHDVFLQLSSPDFDAATFEIWGSLLNGAKLVLFGSDKPTDVNHIDVLLKENDVSILWLTRALFDSLYTQNNNLFKNLQYLLVGGEALTPHIINKLVNSEARPKHILNGYGPTEGTTFTTIFECEGSHDNYPIGKAINTRKLYVLNADRNLVPKGAIGELYIGGAGVAKGYLNKQALTEERFLLNPFASKDDISKGYTHFYKTGDLVRWSDEGLLEYYGRNDSQVKIRGYRIELSEIENVLNEMEFISQSTVICQQHNNNQYLVAYVIRHDNSEFVLECDSLRSELLKSLPEYMVPTIFKELDNFPLTVNGKLDRNALPYVELSNINNYVAPTTKTEIALCEVWQDILELERVGITDNFFRIGGNSILSLHVIGEINKIFNVNIDIPTLYENLTIEELSSFIDNIKNENNHDNVVISI
ncbi:amino acid adenylation domain-containing protein [Vibrio sp. TBV020]|uniref:amino acid adenylation domain-containing protein n=1 Tax=Vibrio sp. TBV020 TaxID=3137398 RepID=UPI0038CD93CF